MTKTQKTGTVDVRQHAKAEEFVFLKIASCLLILAVASGCTSYSPPLARDLYVDAVKLSEDGQKQAAIDKLNQAVQINQRYSIAFSLLGEIYMEIQDYEKSSESYEKATELFPWSFDDYFNLGKANQIMKKFLKAAVAYGKACDLDPNHFDAHVNAAKCYHEVQDSNNVLLYSQRAIEIDPNAWAVMKMVGDIYESRKDYEQAVRFYKRALEVDSNDPNTMLALAITYLKTSDTQPARELLQAVVLAEPNNGVAHKYLGYCSLKLENIDASIGNYARAVEIDSNDWDARRGLGVAYILKGKKEDGSVDEDYKNKAIEQWNTSLSINPDQPNSSRLLKLIQGYSQSQ